MVVTVGLIVKKIIMFPNMLGKKWEATWFFFLFLLFMFLVILKINNFVVKSASIS